MHDLVELATMLDKLSKKGPDKAFLKKMQASGVSISDAFTLGHSAALLDVIGWLQEKRREKKS